MVIKWFPAAIAAVFVAPALAAAQAPATQPVAVPNAPAPVQQAPPPAPVPAAREMSLLGLVIVPDRSDRPVVQSVEPGSPAAAAGFHEDDLITGIGRQATPTVPQLLNFAIPFIRDLDPGTKLNWHVDREGQQVTVAMPRPSDRELGPLSDIERNILERQSGSLGYASSEVPVRPSPPRPYVRRHHVGHDRYADVQYNWWYDGDEMPGVVTQWLNQTIAPYVTANRPYQYYWWYDGDGMPLYMAQWIKNAGAAQSGALNPDLQYSWWYDGD
jgi:hypothetical protein